MNALILHAFLKLYRILFTSQWEGNKASLTLKFTVVKKSMTCFKTITHVRFPFEETLCFLTKNTVNEARRRRTFFPTRDFAFYISYDKRNTNTRTCRFGVT